METLIKNDSIRTLIQETQETGGSSVSLIGEPLPESGYMVGGYVDSLIFDSGLLGHGTVAYDMILRWVSSHAALATKFSVFVGGWIDTDTDLVYIDLSQHFIDKSDALAVARFHDEIAIWDLSSKREIRVN